jgi:hypothetical protein
MMKRTVTLLVVFALAGCETTVKERVVEVKVPVAVQPIHPDQLPAPVAPLGPRPSSLSAATDILMSHWCAAVGYMIKADPLLRISAGMKQEALQQYPECEAH